MAKSWAVVTDTTVDGLRPLHLVAKYSLSPSGEAKKWSALDKLWIQSGVSYNIVLPSQAQARTPLPSTGQNTLPELQLEICIFCDFKE